jgi:hypothetical protein
MTYPCNGKSGSRVGKGMDVGVEFMSVGVSVSEKGIVGYGENVGYGESVGKTFMPVGVSVGKKRNVGKAVAVAGMGDLVGVLKAVGVPTGAGERVPQAARSRIITSQEKRFRNADIIMCLSCQSILGFANLKLCPSYSHLYIPVFYQYHERKYFTFPSK